MPSKFGGVPVESKFGGVPVDQGPQAPGVSNPVQANPEKYTPKEMQGPPVSVGAQMLQNFPYSAANALMHPMAAGIPSGQPQDAFVPAPGSQAKTGHNLMGGEYQYSDKGQVPNPKYRGMSGVKEFGKNLMAPFQNVVDDPAGAAMAVTGMIGAGNEVLPSRARAVRNLDEVESQIGHVPVNTSHFEQPLKDAARQFDLTRDAYPPIMRATSAQLSDPLRPPLNFADSRLKASSAGKKAMQQSVKPDLLQGPMVKHAAGFAEGLDKANQEAADTAGLGEQHRAGMTEYGQNAGLRNGMKAVGKTALIGGGMGGLAYGGKRLLIDKLLGQ